MDNHGSFSACLNITTYMEFVPFDPEKSLSKPSTGGHPRALLIYISSFINTRIGIDFQKNQTGNRPHIQNKEYQPAGANF